MGSLGFVQCRHALRSVALDRSASESVVHEEEVKLDGSRPARSGARSFDWGLAGIILLGFAVRTAWTWNVNFLPDEPLHLEHSMMVAGGRLDIGWYHYPSGFYFFSAAVLALKYLVGRVTGTFSSPQDFVFAYLVNPKPDLIAIRVAAALASSLGLIWIFRTGRQLSGRRVGLLAALVGALLPGSVRWGVQIWPESLMLLPVSIATFHIVKLVKEGNPRDASIAGLLVGVAAAIKYNAGFLCWGIACAVLLSPGSSAIGMSRLARLKTLALSAGAALGSLMLLTPFTFVPRNFMTFMRGFSTWRGQADIMIGWEQHFAFQRPGAGAQLLWLWKAFEAQAPGFLFLVLAGLTLIWSRSRKLGIAFTATIVGAVALLILVRIGEPYHLLPLAPLFAVSAGYFLGEALPLGPPRTRTVLSVLIGAVITLSWGQSLWNLIGDRRLPDSREVARSWIEANIPDGTKLVVDKGFVPNLVREEAQVRSDLAAARLTEPSSGRRLELEAQIRYRPKYSLVRIPISLASSDSTSSPRVESGRVVQGRLPEPQEWVSAGCKYMILSSYLYRRFWGNPAYPDLDAYYRRLMKAGPVVFEVGDFDSASRPKISVIRLAGDTQTGTMEGTSR